MEVNEKLLTKFLQECRSYNDHHGLDTFCESFKIGYVYIDIKIGNHGFPGSYWFEIVKIELYKEWIKNKRDLIIDQLLDQLI